MAELSHRDDVIYVNVLFKVLSIIKKKIFEKKKIGENNFDLVIAIVFSHMHLVIWYLKEAWLNAPNK